MKKLLTIIGGLCLANTSIFSTVACTNETHTVEYKSNPGFESSEVSNVFVNKNNVPLIFILFGTLNKEQRFLVIENKENDSSAIKVRNFYNISFLKQSYQEKSISDIKYSYTNETFIINDQHIKADVVTKIDFIK